MYTPTETFSARLSVDAQPRGGETTNGRTFNTPTPLFYSDGSAQQAAFDVQDKDGDAFRIAVRDLTGAVSIERVTVPSLLTGTPEKK